MINGRMSGLQEVQVNAGIVNSLVRTVRLEEAAGFQAV
jgi:hypothetical protein